VGLEGGKSRRVQRDKGKGTGAVTLIFLRLTVTKGVSGINSGLKTCGSGME